MRSVSALVWVVLLQSACGGSKALPACEPTSASLVARTTDGKATIASLAIHPRSGQCMVLSGCIPAAGAEAGAAAPCSEVRISCFGGATGCDLTFTSVEGLSFMATATVSKAEGTDYACTLNGQTITAFGKVFDPPVIEVDFSKQGDDAGAADR
jgi:hypothetical protein